jgi:hypothetical protein
VKEKMLNEGNQIHNFISSSGSDFLTSYGSGSARQKVPVPTVPVPVPQHCLPKIHLNTLSQFLLVYSTVFTPQAQRRTILQYFSVAIILPNSGICEHPKQKIKQMAKNLFTQKKI